MKQSINTTIKFLSLGLVLFGIASFAFGQNDWGTFRVFGGRKNLTSSTTIPVLSQDQLNVIDSFNASSTAHITGDLSLGGDLIVVGENSTTKLRAFEKGTNNYMITSNINASGIKDAGPGGAGSVAYTNWINFEPLVLKLVNSEDGSYINNMVQINPVRTEFGPPGGSGADEDKRIGPSNERNADGVNPAYANQLYQLLLPSNNGINGWSTDAVPVCLNTSVANRIEQCGPANRNIIGTTQEAVVAGGNTFFNTVGISRNVICKGTINIGDLLVTGTAPLDSYYLMADNNAASAHVVGTALTTCATGHVDVLLGARSYATPNQTIGDHIISTGARPTVSSCGTNPTIDGTDAAGKVTIGASISGDETCSITFNRPYTKAPACFASNETNPSAGHNVTVASTATGLTIKVANNFSAGESIAYGCIGF